MEKTTKKIIVCFIVALVLSNYTTYEITRTQMIDKVALLLGMLKSGEITITGYKVLTESEYNNLTKKIMEDKISKPLWWKPGPGMDNTTEFCYVTVRKYSD